MSKVEDVTEVEIFKEKTQQDISDLQQNFNMLKKDVDDLKINDKLQDKDITSLQSMFSEIKDDTNWIRRKITGAFITALITAVVAGLVGIAISQLF